MLHLSGMLVLILLLALFVWLRPMSANFLDYLVWKCTTSASSQAGSILSNGAVIRYAAYGQGEPVLLLHGGLSNKLSWFSQLPWLVKAGRRVVLIDTRGHGDSTLGHSALSYEIFADDSLRVLDKLKIHRTDIIGWSDGGIVALILGLEAPQRVGKIIAISANFHPSGLIPETGLREPGDTISRIKRIDWLRGWWSGAGEKHADLEARIKQLWRTAPRLDHADLKAITAPTLVIAGENDIIALAHSGELAQTLAHGTLEIVLGAGHSAPITHAKRINNLIASFLQIGHKERENG